MKIQLSLRMFLFSFVLLIPAAVFGQGSGSRPPSVNPGEESNLVITKSASGHISAFNDGVISVKDKKGKEVQIAVTKQTKVYLGKKKIDPDEIEESMFTLGRLVKIVYRPVKFAGNTVDKVAVELRFIEEKNTKKPEFTEKAG